jgi:hypothetical protein
MAANKADPGSALVIAYGATRTSGGFRSGRVPRSGGVEGVVVNLSDVQRAGRYGATSSAVALLTSLGWRSSSLIGLSKAIDPSERSRRSAICHSS